METKVLQVFYGKDCLPYKDKERAVHFPIIGAAIQGASNTTDIRFYFDKLVEEDDETTTWVVVSKLPNGKIGSEIVETQFDEELNERYVLFNLNNFYTQAKGDLFLSLQGYQGGVRVETDPETNISQIYGTPTIQATGSIKLAIKYATQLIGSGETSNITLQKILAELGTKLGIREYTVRVDELPLVGETNVFYAIYDDPSNPNKLNIYIWNATTKSYVWVGDNTLDLGDYYTQEQGEQFEQDVRETIGDGSPKGVYATLSDLESAFPTGTNGIYLVSADGHWYYWNGSAWTDGGVYLSSVPDSSFDLNGQNSLKNSTISNAFKNTIYDVFKNKSFVNGNWSSFGERNTLNLGRCGFIDWEIAKEDMHFIAGNGYQIAVCVASSLSPLTIGRNYPFEYTGDVFVAKGETFVISIRTFPEVSATTYEDMLPKLKNCYVFTNSLTKVEKENIFKATLSFITPSKFNYNGFISTGNNPSYPIGSYNESAGYRTTDLIRLEANKTYIIYASCTINTAILSKWIVDTSNPDRFTPKYLWVENLVIDSQGGDLKFYEYTPNEDMFVRLCTKASDENNTQIFEKNDLFRLYVKYINSNSAIINNNLYGKKINVIGDSYVAGNGNVNATWHKKMATKYNMVYRNYGEDGNPLIAPYKNGVPVIPVVARYQNMDNDADIVVVIGGKNDFNTQYPINDFKTGLRTLCEGLIAKYPTKRIMFFTPWRVPMSTLIECDPSLSSYTIPLVDYCDAILEICKEYSIPVFDTKNSAMFLTNSTFRTTYMQSSTDISHTNSAGGDRFEPIGQRFLEDNI